jgi:hypothetical protein
VAVFEGSRYATAAVIRTAAADGKVRPTLYSMIAPVSRRAAYRSYVVQEGDRYDLLAQRLFGDPELWWAIADLNPEFLFPAGIPAGTIIRLPAV